MMYTWNFYSDVYQLFLNKSGEKKFWDKIQDQCFIPI